MLATAITPADFARRSGQDWCYERKLDGLRCLAVRNDDRVELWSRNHLPFTARFPAVVRAVAGIGAHSAVVDGEIVAFDGDRTSFSLLQQRLPETEAVFLAFDLLEVLGRDITHLPLTERRHLLEMTLDGATGPHLAVVDQLGGSADELLAGACGRGWEGLVAKRRSSPYRAGRSPDWYKLKCVVDQELVVGGWTEPSGSRVGIGALLVGYHDDEGLRFAGRVGTGFRARDLVAWHRELRAIEVDRDPFLDAGRQPGAHWCRPDLVVSVGFAEWTPDGRLRHPRFLGRRDDKAASEVRRDAPPAPRVDP